MSRGREDSQKAKEELAQAAARVTIAMAGATGGTTGLSFLSNDSDSGRSRSNSFSRSRSNSVSSDNSDEDEWKEVQRLTRRKKCHRCGAMDHVVTECDAPTDVAKRYLENRANSSGNESDHSEMMCNYCKERGHIVRNCPKAKRKQEMIADGTWPYQNSGRGRGGTGRGLFAPMSFRGGYVSAGRSTGTNPYAAPSSNCFSCGKSGHYRKDCPDKTSSASSTEGSEDEENKKKFLTDDELDAMPGLYTVQFEDPHTGQKLTYSKLKYVTVYGPGGVKTNFTRSRTYKPEQYKSAEEKKEAKEKKREDRKKAREEKTDEQREAEAKAMAAKKYANTLEGGVWQAGVVKDGKFKVGKQVPSAGHYVCRFANETNDQFIEREAEGKKKHDKISVMKAQKDEKKALALYNYAKKAVNSERVPTYNGIAQCLFCEKILNLCKCNDVIFVQKDKHIVDRKRNHYIGAFEQKTIPDEFKNKKVDVDGTEYTLGESYRAFKKDRYDGPNYPLEVFETGSVTKSYPHVKRALTKFEDAYGVSLVGTFTDQGQTYTMRNTILPRHANATVDQEELETKTYSNSYAAEVACLQKPLPVRPFDFKNDADATFAVAKPNGSVIEIKVSSTGLIKNASDTKVNKPGMSGLPVLYLHEWVYHRKVNTKEVKFKELIVCGFIAGETFVSFVNEFGAFAMRPEEIKPTSANFDKYKLPAEYFQFYIPLEKCEEFESTEECARYIRSLPEYVEGHVSLYGESSDYQVNLNEIARQHRSGDPEIPLMSVTRKGRKNMHKRERKEDPRSAALREGNHYTRRGDIVRVLIPERTEAASEFYKKHKNYVDLCYKRRCNESHTKFMYVLYYGKVYIVPLCNKCSEKEYIAMKGARIMVGTQFYDDTFKCDECKSGRREERRKPRFNPHIEIDPVPSSDEEVPDLVENVGGKDVVIGVEVDRDVCIDICSDELDVSDEDLSGYAHYDARRNLLRTRLRSRPYSCSYTKCGVCSFFWLFAIYAIVYLAFSVKSAYAGEVFKFPDKNGIRGDVVETIIGYNNAKLQENGFVAATSETDDIFPEYYIPIYRNSKNIVSCDKCKEFLYKHKDYVKKSNNAEMKRRYAQLDKMLKMKYLPRDFETSFSAFVSQLNKCDVKGNILSPMYDPKGTKVYVESAYASRHGCSTTLKIRKKNEVIRCNHTTSICHDGDFLVCTGDSKGEKCLVKRYVPPNCKGRLIIANKKPVPFMPVFFDTDYPNLYDSDGALECKIRKGYDTGICLIHYYVKQAERDDTVRVVLEHGYVNVRTEREGLRIATMRSSRIYYDKTIDYIVTSRKMKDIKCTIVDGGRNPHHTIIECKMFCLYETLKIVVGKRENSYKIKCPKDLTILNLKHYEDRVKVLQGNHGFFSGIQFAKVLSYEAKGYRTKFQDMYLKSGTEQTYILKHSHISTLMVDIYGRNETCVTLDTLSRYYDCNSTLIPKFYTRVLYQTRNFVAILETGRDYCLSATGTASAGTNNRLRSIKCPGKVGKQKFYIKKFGHFAVENFYGKVITAAYRRIASEITVEDEDDDNNLQSWTYTDDGKIVLRDHQEYCMGVNALSQVLLVNVTSAECKPFYMMIASAKKLPRCLRLYNEGYVGSVGVCTKNKKSTTVTQLIINAVVTRYTINTNDTEDFYLCGHEGIDTRLPRDITYSVSDVLGFMLPRHIHDKMKFEKRKLERKPDFGRHNITIKRDGVHVNLSNPTDIYIHDGDKGKHIFCGTSCLLPHPVDSTDYSVTVNGKTVKFRKRRMTWWEKNHVWLITLIISCTHIFFCFVVVYKRGFNKKGAKALLWYHLYLFFLMYKIIGYILYYSWRIIRRVTLCTAATPRSFVHGLSTVKDAADDLEAKTDGSASVSNLTAVSENKKITDYTSVDIPQSNSGMKLGKGKLLVTLFYTLCLVQVTKAEMRTIIDDVTVFSLILAVFSVIWFIIYIMYNSIFILNTLGKAIHEVYNLLPNVPGRQPLRMGPILSKALVLLSCVCVMAEKEVSEEVKLYYKAMDRFFDTLFYMLIVATLGFCVCCCTCVGRLLPKPGRVRPMLTTIFYCMMIILGGKCYVLEENEYVLENNQIKVHKQTIGGELSMNLQAPALAIELDPEVGSKHLKPKVATFKVVDSTLFYETDLVGWTAADIHSIVGDHSCHKWFKDAKILGCHSNGHYDNASGIFTFCQRRKVEDTDSDCNCDTCFEEGYKKCLTHYSIDRTSDVVMRIKLRPKYMKANVLIRIGGVAQEIEVYVDSDSEIVTKFGNFSFSPITSVFDPIPRYVTYYKGFIYDTQWNPYGGVAQSVLGDVQCRELDWKCTDMYVSPLKQWLEDTNDMKCTVVFRESGYERFIGSEYKDLIRDEHFQCKVEVDPNGADALVGVPKVYCHGCNVGFIQFSMTVIDMRYKVLHKPFGIKDFSCHTVKKGHYGSHEPTVLMIETNSDMKGECKVRAEGGNVSFAEIDRGVTTIYDALSVYDKSEERTVTVCGLSKKCTLSADAPERATLMDEEEMSTKTNDVGSGKAWCFFVCNLGGFRIPWWGQGLLATITTIIVIVIVLMILSCAWKCVKKIRKKEE